MKRTSPSIVLYSIFTCVISCFLVRLGASQTDNSAASSEAMVLVDHARFTVLTPELIRMEWSEDGQFVDNASLVFVNRKLPVPRYTVSTQDGWQSIKTEKLLLRYREHSGEFAGNNLEVTFMCADRRVVWRPGMKDTAISHRPPFPHISASFPSGLKNRMRK